MSKSQRACDNCRTRKSACRIENAPPCRLCALYGRDCTFNGTPRATRIIARATSISDEVNPTQAPIPGLLNFEAQCGQHAEGPVLSPQYTVNDQRTELLPGISVQQFPILETPLEFESSWSDQAILDMHAEGFSVDLSPTNILDAGPSASQLSGLATFSTLCGLTGDMDPYVLREYQFGGDHRFVFKRQAIHSLSQGVPPVQFLVSPASKPAEPEQSDTLYDQLTQLVAPDPGRKFIELYEAAPSTSTSALR